MLLTLRLHSHQIISKWTEISQNSTTCRRPLLVKLTDRWLLALYICHASQIALMVKNTSTNAGDVRDTGLIPGSGISPGKDMMTHSNILAWRIPWTEEPRGYSSQGRTQSEKNWSDLVCTRVHGMWSIEY